MMAKKPVRISNDMVPAEVKAELADILTSRELIIKALKVSDFALGDKVTRKQREAAKAVENAQLGMSSVDLAKWVGMDHSRAVERLANIIISLNPGSSMQEYRYEYELMGRTFSAYRIPRKETLIFLMQRDVHIANAVIDLIDNLAGMLIYQGQQLIKARAELKENHRVTYTDSIKRCYERNNIPNKPRYGSEQNMIYMIVLGCTSEDYEDEYGYPIRDSQSDPEVLRALDAVQARIGALWDMDILDDELRQKLARDFYSNWKLSKKFTKETLPKGLI